MSLLLQQEIRCLTSTSTRCKIKQVYREISSWYPQTASISLRKQGEIEETLISTTNLNNLDKRITKLGRRQWHHRQTTLFPWKQRRWKEDDACYACSYRIGWKRKWNPHVLKFKDPVFLCNDTSRSLLQQKASRAWYTPFRVRDNQYIYIYTSA